MKGTDDQIRLLRDAIRYRESRLAEDANMPLEDRFESRRLVKEWRMELNATLRRRERKAWPIQAMRGMGRLPHVGPHPGNEFMILMLGMAAAAGAGRAEGFMDWLITAPVFVALMVICLGPFYLSGCVSRANTSDRFRMREAKGSGTDPK